MKMKLKNLFNLFIIAGYLSAFIYLFHSPSFHYFTIASVTPHSFINETHLSGGVKIQ